MLDMVAMVTVDWAMDMDWDTAPMVWVTVTDSELMDIQLTVTSDMALAGDGASNNKPHSLPPNCISNSSTFCSDPSLYY